MNFFGMGPMEIMVIMVVALIIFGPGKLPEIGAQVGKGVRDFRRATRDLTAEFQESIDDVQTTMGEMKSTVTDMKKETAALAASVPATIEGVDRPRSSAAGTVGGSDGNVVEQPKQDGDVVTVAATREDPLADMDLELLDEEPPAAPTVEPR